MNVKFTTDENVIKRGINSYYMKEFSIGENGLVMFTEHKHYVTLNKPIYVGVAVMNLSKVMMYDLWYNKLQKQYGQSIKLLYTDTDSFIFLVECKDFYETMDMDMWDTSNYPKNHPKFSNKNKRVPGKLKDETKGIPITEDVNLRAKQYAFKMDNSITKIEIDENWKAVKCVGKVIKSSVLKTANFDSYYNALFHNFQRDNMTQRAQWYGFVSKKHQIYTQKFDKAFVSSFDDKMFELADGISRLPHGHYVVEEIRQGIIPYIYKYE